MYAVELYGRVRRACHVDGMSKSEAARLFGIDRKTVAKILKHSVPPGYRRSKQPVRRGRPRTPRLRNPRRDRRKMGLRHQGLHQVGMPGCLTTLERVVSFPIRDSAESRSVIPCPRGRYGGFGWANHILSSFGNGSSRVSKRVIRIDRPRRDSGFR